MTGHTTDRARLATGQTVGRTKQPRKASRRALILLLCALAAACSADVENLYANIRAFFRFTPVTQVPGLHAALNNPGLFCAITFPNGKYRFAGSDGSTFDYTPTAMDQYGKPECVGGFIVGMPNIPDLNGNFYDIAFDLVCPNCYSNNAVQRNLTLRGTDALCGRCNRRYDLNNSGIVSAGDNGRGLYRYHISYTQAQNLLLIQN